MNTSIVGKVTNISAVTLTLLLTLFQSTSYAKDSTGRVLGLVRDISTSSISVASLTCTVSPSVECENSSSVAIECSSIKSGDRVRLTCVNGVAKNIELLSSSGSSSSSSSSSSAGSSSSASSESSSSKSSKSSSSKSRSSNSSDSTNKKDRNLRTTFSPLSGAVTSLTGSARFQSSSKGKEQQLTAALKLPLPSTLPPASTLEEARALTFSLTLFRAGIAYATCTFKSDSSNSKQSLLKQEYNLEVKRSEGKLRVKKGSCDTNLATAEIQRGVPLVLKADTLVVEEAASGVLLEATF